MIDILRKQIEGGRTREEKIDFKKARQDMARFIEDKEELKLIERDVFLKILR